MRKEIGGGVEEERKKTDQKKMDEDFNWENSGLNRNETADFHSAEEGQRTKGSRKGLTARNGIPPLFADHKQSQGGTK